MSLRTRTLRPLALVALPFSLLAVSAGGCHRRARTETTVVTSAGGDSSYIPGAAPPPPPATMVVTGAADVAAVRSAIARALEQRRYVIESETGTRLVARWSPRRVTLTVAIDYSPSQVSISYVQSSGVDFGEDRGLRQWDGWMRQLTHQIQDEVARPERERQEAIAHAEEQRRDDARRHDEAQLQAQRERIAAEERGRERDRQERLERERLATARAQAEADAQSARARAAEAQARPRIDVGLHASVGRLRYDANEARALGTALTVTAGFSSDPYFVDGTAGGPVPGRQMGFPAGCPGWFQAEPQHTLVLPYDMNYLRVEVPSDGDATIAIVTPDGNVWCDDDSAGNLTPRLEGMFPAGVYRVYVGNYQRGSMVRHSLLLSERGAGPGYVAGYAQAPQVVEPAAPPAPPNCRQVLIEVGQPSTSMMFCDGVEPYCAAALLRAGHPATSLMFCRDVDPQCAVPLLQSGRNPTELQFCR
ncbi:MAG: hypothetical protein U0353_30045 [Sandaracinus sp.]